MTLSFGIQIDPSPNTSATLSFFYQTGPYKLLDTTPAQALGYKIGQLEILKLTTIHEDAGEEAGESAAGASK